MSVGLRSKAFANAEEFLEFDGSDTGGQLSCLIVDVRMPGISGLDLQSRLVEKNRARQIIFMSAFGDVAMTARAMKAGARDFLQKPFRDQDMLDAVVGALEYDRRMRAIEESRDTVQELYRSLSPRERTVLRMLGDGLTNKQIAAKLCVSEITVRVGRRTLMQKMKARNFAQLIKVESLTRGLVGQTIPTSYDGGASEVSNGFLPGFVRFLRDHPE
ncbi:FixJ family two-component response regulator [Paraburkholderia rhizosphaerae]|uniref:FixJ family two-component response regulator n=1 Tax=Paraburkholderia rhizosphaerae TaxID=480658 RepID=A0A4V3HCN6_9BURK|nr:FixJ family two-component response regulator [Paraburkholderia rhizosphaerae]